MRILNFKGRNWRLKISPLNGLIDPAACKIKVKNNSLTLELKKAKKKHWDDIKQKKSLVSADDDLGTTSKDKEGDPGASLMNMMKELY